jgi:membrane protease YdiL (CAAX protease family)
MSTVTTTSQPATSSPLKRLLSGHPLVAYFVIALGGTWLTILPLLLGKDGIGLFPYSFGQAGQLIALLATFTGPLFASYVVTALTSGKAGMRALLRRYVQWRVGVQWYFAALFAGLLIWLAGFSILLNGEPLFALIAHPSLLLSVYLISLPLLIVFSFGEETGWRGFALPRLQQRYGPLLGTLLLAVLHGLWHIPALLVPGFISASVLSLPFIVGWIATVMCATFLYSWIFNNTRGSLLIAILVHAGSFNASSSLMNALIPAHPALSGWQAALYSSSWNNGGSLIPFAVFAVLLIVATRGRLGYRPDRAPQLVEASQPVETPLANV